MPKLPPNFSIQKAHQTQLCLSKSVIREDRIPKPICTVGGVDVAYIGEMGIGATVVLDYNSLKVIETSIAICPVKMPYVPSLLSFRELPFAMAAIKKLKCQPDVFLVDSQGYAHPFRCGFASHLGLVLGKPTIGAAKSRLIGEPQQQNGRVLLIDKNEVIGEIVETQPNRKPIYVSIGNMVTLETAVEIVRHCSINRIPEPTLQAHNLATETKRKSHPSIASLPNLKKVKVNIAKANYLP